MGRINVTSSIFAGTLVPNLCHDVFGVGVLGACVLSLLVLVAVLASRVTNWLSNHDVRHPFKINEGVKVSRIIPSRPFGYDQV